MIIPPNCTPVGQSKCATYSPRVTLFAYVIWEPIVNVLVCMLIKPALKHCLECLFNKQNTNEIRFWCGAVLTNCGPGWWHTLFNNFCHRVWLTCSSNYISTSNVAPPLIIGTHLSWGKHDRALIWWREGINLWSVKLYLGQSDTNYECIKCPPVAPFINMDYLWSQHG